MENGKRMKRRSHRQNNFKAVVYYKTTWLEANTHRHTAYEAKAMPGRTYMKRVCVWDWGRLCDGHRVVWMDICRYVCICMGHGHTHRYGLILCVCAFWAIYRKRFQYIAYRVLQRPYTSFSTQCCVVLFVSVWQEKACYAAHSWTLQKCTLYSAL